MVSISYKWLEYLFWLLGKNTLSDYSIYIKIFEMVQKSDSKIVWLRYWIPNPGVPWSKPLGGSEVDSTLHFSEVDKMSTKNVWELGGKK